MKRVLSILIAIIMVIGLSGCFGLFEDEEKTTSKTYYVGESQEIKGVFVKPTEVLSTEYGSEWLVKVCFEIENTNDSAYYLNWLHFNLNDTWTIYETSSKYTDIPSGGFSLVKGNVYNFYVSFIVKYSHEEKDMIFIWSKSSMSSKNVQWVL